MITKLNNYDSPDLRAVPKYVKCIKSKIVYKKIIFNKGYSYKVGITYGDPEKAINKFKLDYMPLECVYTIGIRDDYNDYWYFITNSKDHTVLKNEYKFFEYFELLSKQESDICENAEKYNL